MTETRRAARQVGELSGLFLDLDLQHALARAEANRLASDELEVADAGQSGLRAHGSLGGLDGERVARAPAVQLEVNAPGQILVEQEPCVVAADASEPEALGQADEKERVVDRLASGAEVEVEEVLIAAELGAEEPAAALGRGAPEDGETVAAASLGASDEQRLGRAQSPGALTQMLLDGYRQSAAGKRVVTPDSAVLDEDPVLDPAGSGAERLSVLARDLRAEGFAEPKALHLLPAGRRRR